MSLSAKQWKRIHVSQKKELDRILANKSFAEKISQMDRYAKIGSWLPKDRRGRVLELGCGPGRYVALLSQLGHEVVGVDPVSYPTWAQLRQLPNVQIHDKVFSESLPFGNESFDYVACIGALLYFPQDHAALHEINRVLKIGGRLIIRTINKENLYTKFTGQKLDPASINLYTVDELNERLLKHGFDVAETCTYGFWPPFCTQYWWYLVNGTIPDFAQHLLSLATPRSYRVNITALARKVRSEPAIQKRQGQG